MSIQFEKCISLLSHCKYYYCVQTIDIISTTLL